MPNTIYATFLRESDAERAAGALMDHGIAAQDLGFILAEKMRPAQTEFAGDLIPSAPVKTPIAAPEGTVMVGASPAPSVRTIPADTPLDVVEHEARGIVDMTKEEPRAASGITTTTGGDAGKGALGGTVIGVGLGVLLGLAAVTIPGVGLVAGTGALAAGLAAATGAAGTVAGGVFGYLSDLGVPAESARRLSETVATGGPILSINVTGATPTDEIVMLLKKYHATSVEDF